MDLKKLVDEYQVNMAASKADLVGHPASTRGGAKSAVRQALKAVEEIEAQYEKEMQVRGAVIAVTGPYSLGVEFSEIAEDEGEAVTVDGNAMYQRLFLAVRATMTRTTRKFGTNQRAILHQELEEIAKAHGAVLARKSLSVQKEIDREEALFDTIKEYVRDLYGDTLNALYIKREASLLALREMRDGPVIPIVVLGVEDLCEVVALSGLFGGNVVEVEVKSKPSKKTVLESFNELKKKLKAMKKESN